MMYVVMLLIFAMLYVNSVVVDVTQAQNFLKKTAELIFPILSSLDFSLCLV